MESALACFVQCIGLCILPLPVYSLYSQEDRFSLKYADDSVVVSLLKDNETGQLCRSL